MAYYHCLGMAMTFRECIRYYLTFFLTVWFILAIQLDLLAVEKDLANFEMNEAETPLGYLSARKLLFVRRNRRVNEAGQYGNLYGKIEEYPTAINSSEYKDGGQSRVYGPEAETSVGTRLVPSNVTARQASNLSTRANQKTTSSGFGRMENDRSSVKILNELLKQNTSTLHSKSTQSPKDLEIELEIKNMKKSVEEINNRQLIRNENIFGPVKNDTRILIVQVHKRLENLKYLVESLQQVKGIEESLVIFSHDFWDQTINDFVANITSFRVLQMFFPFSIQLHPKAFPGRDPRDCDRNVKGKRPRCSNSPWADSYGHYREEHLTQIKHHWLWKIYRVFEDLRISRYWDGWIIFLEEDHYVAPDILHVLNTLVLLRGSFCPHCRVICLGNYKPRIRPKLDVISTGDWVVTSQNLGYALDRSVWNSIKDCGEIFCTFDDYNWDWTLNRLVQACCFPKLTALSIDLTRVAHVGSCGTHVKERRCNVSLAVERAKASFHRYRHLLFPESFAVRTVLTKLPDFKKSNGGWGDLRDRLLCKAIVNGTASDETVQRLQFANSPKYFVTGKGR
ncbi:alpha-1,6-mannosyl-glycoprotein 2-beta-N-acetylglucosaminyltransferase-like [Palaemon carinicauda]|uniref:alpha-1,6-mannosyl-glycoprotein 2-beta-N-acetylglucosaminyltransferase-like n=1 Tax=Palaemon carinicauda TaxID=392227 RepID=UPI0035B6641C